MQKSFYFRNWNSPVFVRIKNDQSKELFAVNKIEFYRNDWAIACADVTRKMVFQ